MKKPNFPKLPAWLKTMPKWLIMVGVFLVIFFITNLFSAGPTEYDPLQFAQTRRRHQKLRHRYQPNQERQ
jgi:hypothetical protein